MSRIFEYKENYDAIASLPLVQKLLKKVDKLKRKNTKLKEQNKALKTVIYTLPQFMNKKNKLPKLRKSSDIVIKSECFEPTLCDTLVDDDHEVVFMPNIDKEVDTYDLTEDDEDNDAKENITAVIEEVEEEELEETVASLEVEEEEVEEEVEEEEVEEEELEEEEDESNEREGASEGTVGSLEEEREGASEGTVGSLEEEEVFEIKIKGKAYYTTNEKSGKIYAIDENEDVGDEIGEFKEGKAVFYKK